MRSLLHPAAVQHFVSGHPTAENEKHCVLGDDMRGEDGIKCSLTKLETEEGERKGNRKSR